MGSWDIVGMVISFGRTHAFRHYMIRDDFGAVNERFAANPAFHVLLNDLAGQQSPHFRWRPEFPVASRVMWILNALNGTPGSPSFPNLIPPATEYRLVNWTSFVLAESHMLCSPGVV